MKRFEPEWLSYRKQVIPASASSTQVEECRRAFYAGAAAIHRLIMTMLDPGAEPTEADLRKMSELHDELLEFGISLGMPRRPQ